MTMKPIPPSQCRMARHKRMPGGATSRPTITVAPVVVMPDTDSNTASARVRLSSENASGSAAKNPTTIHTEVVRRKAWRPVSAALP